MAYLGFEANRETKSLVASGIAANNGVRTANVGTGSLAGGGVAYGAPKFYSPIHTPTTWQIPTKRREVMLWCRFFASNEPRVGSALDIYSQLPITEFENICEDEAVTSYYNDLVRRLKLNDFLNKVAYEYFGIGDAFVFANIACEKCNGSGVTPGSARKDGSYIPCAHEGGTFHSLTLLNPDWVEVVTSSLTQESILFLIPGNDVKNIVQRQSPPELYNRIPDFIKQAVALGKPIQLHPMCTAHLAHNPGNGPYGRSIISRLFRTLAYKDKILQAQWIAADRHILPVRIVKIGSEQIPATEQDIASMQQQLLQISQDPTVTLVTHHAVDYDFVGASGKVMQLGKEYDMIDQEILDGLMINKALLNGEGPTYNCHNAETTEFMTVNGWKKYNDVREDDLLATFNNKNGNLEYQKYINRFEYDFDGELMHFKSSKLDCQVTDNHNMLVLPRNDKDRSKGLEKWRTIKASDVKPRSAFRGCVEGFEGVVSKNINIPKELTLEEYVELACFYITEGWLGDYNKGRSYTVFISQNENTNIDNCKKILSLTSKFDKNTKRPVDEHGNCVFRITSKDLQDNLKENFGELAQNKKLPLWFKNLPIEYLKKALDIFSKTDGNVRKANKKNIDCNKKYYTAITSSSNLADDIQEIALKCGFAPKKANIDAKGYNGYSNKTGHKYISKLDLYRVYWSDGEFEKYPSIEKTKEYPSKIKKLPYKGKIACFEVPNHFLITRVNGKIIITGNSASVGLEAFIKRLDNFRGILKRFIEEKIYLPVALMQGFTTKNERNEEEPLYPKVRFKEMRLRDDTQQKNVLLQMADKKYISQQTLLEYFNIDFNIEINRLRMENILQTEFNLNEDDSGGGGGLGGGLPDMGGGGPPPMDMDMGGDDMGGGGPPMDMGGGGPGPEASMPSPKAFFPMSRPVVTKHPRKITKESPQYTKEELERMKPKKLSLNIPEQKIFKTLEEMQKRGEIRTSFVPQYRVFRERKFVLDFAFPKIKLGIEVDGPLHDTPDQINADGEKDMYFEKMGWMIVRFKENDINKHLDDIVIPHLKKIIANRFKQFSTPAK